MECNLLLSGKQSRNVEFHKLIESCFANIGSRIPFLPEAYKDKKIECGVSFYSHNIFDIPEESLIFGEPIIIVGNGVGYQHLKIGDEWAYREIVGTPLLELYPYYRKLSYPEISWRQIKNNLSLDYPGENERSGIREVNYLKESGYTVAVEVFFEEDICPLAILNTLDGSIYSFTGVYNSPDGCLSFIIEDPAIDFSPVVIWDVNKRMIRCSL